MFKLTVVAGPNRGASYAVQEGEVSIGRQAGNTVVLQSAKVSKKHCTLVVSNGEVIVQDQGSSNGTFINGTLAKSKKIKPGDRISVGEYVFELSSPPVARVPKAPPRVSGMGQVLQFPVVPGAGGMPGAAGLPGVPGGSMGSSDLAAAAPQDFKGKLLHALDQSVMPFFYSLNFKHEWRVLLISFFGIFAIGNLVISVYPLIEQNRTNVVREMGKRASFMARQLAEKNGPFLAARAETKTDIGSLIETAEGVRVAVLTDLDNRIIAPPSKLNNYLNVGPEAAFATKARDLFRGGRETGLWKEVDPTIVCAVEPVKIYNPQAGKNIVAGMAIVSIDTTIATPDLGEMGVTYSETLILTSLLGGLLLLILYKLTLKPLQTLNDDMDRALKGELGQVTHEFKFEELNSLWDIINSALQRIPKNGGGADLGGGGGMTADDLIGPLRMMANVAKFGVAICDGSRKVLYLNSNFEDISGIRGDSSIGQDFAEVARDQSLGMFLGDLMDRASPSTEGAAEDYDFSGVGHKCYAASFGSPGAVKCYLLAFVKAEG